MPSQDTHGVVQHPASSARRTDYLFRISLKGFIQNSNGKVLVVKETGRTWWDLPGGGMDHTEDLKAAIARELKEEVGLAGDFTYRVIDVDEPALLQPQNFWQLRLIFLVKPANFAFAAGEDGDEIAFVDPREFKNSASKTERRIFDYSLLATDVSQG